MVAGFPDGHWMAMSSAEAVHVVALNGPGEWLLSNDGGRGGLEWPP